MRVGPGTRLASKLRVPRSRRGSPEPRTGIGRDTALRFAPVSPSAAPAGLLSGTLTRDCACRAGGRSLNAHRQSVCKHVPPSTSNAASGNIVASGAGDAGSAGTLPRRPHVSCGGSQETRVAQKHAFSRRRSVRCQVGMNHAVGRPQMGNPTCNCSRPGAVRWPGAEAPGAARRRASRCLLMKAPARLSCNYVGLHVNKHVNAAVHDARRPGHSPRVEAARSAQPPRLATATNIALAVTRLCVSHQRRNPRRRLGNCLKRLRALVHALAGGRSLNAHRKWVCKHVPPSTSSAASGNLIASGADEAGLRRHAAASATRRVRRLARNACSAIICFSRRRSVRCQVGMKHAVGRPQMGNPTSNCSRPGAVHWPGAEAPGAARRRASRCLRVKAPARLSCNYVGLHRQQTRNAAVHDARRPGHSPRVEAARSAQPPRLATIKLMARVVTRLGLSGQSRHPRRRLGTCLERSRVVAQGGPAAVAGARIASGSVNMCRRARAAPLQAISSRVEQTKPACAGTLPRRPHLSCGGSQETRVAQ
jgi:hypothetical protein